jgi:hypothetical protein
MLVGLLIEYYINENFTESDEVRSSKKDGVRENHFVELNIMGDGREQLKRNVRYKDCYYG